MYIDNHEPQITNTYGKFTILVKLYISTLHK